MNDIFFEALRTIKALYKHGSRWIEIKDRESSKITNFK